MIIMLLKVLLALSRNSKPAEGLSPLTLATPSLAIRLFYMPAKLQHQGYSRKKEAEIEPSLSSHDGISGSICICSQCALVDQVSLDRMENRSAVRGGAESLRLVINFAEVFPLVLEREVRKIRSGQARS